MRFVFGVIIGIGLTLGAAFLFLTRYMPVATKGGPMPLEQFLASTALQHAMGGETTKPSPLPANEANLLAGVKIYRTHCDVCHGLPDQKAPTAIASGMFPRPPQLFSGHGVHDDPVGETRWKVANGIRLSGMPGFAGKLTDAEIWQVSLLLAQDAKGLPEPVRRALH
jgi:mono/diheme cytochrome c family protein